MLELLVPLYSVASSLAAGLPSRHRSLMHQEIEKRPANSAQEPTRGRSAGPPAGPAPQPSARQGGGRGAEPRARRPSRLRNPPSVTAARRPQHIKRNGGRRRAASASGYRAP